MSNVVNITRSPKAKAQRKFAEALKMVEDEKEDEFLTAMTLASKLSRTVEELGIRKLIVFVKTKNGWGYEHCNLSGPEDIIEALVPLYATARTALNITKGDAG